jgi:hypothetical protein
MNKETIDELYHNLRLLSNSSSHEEKLAIAGIASHLMHKEGDYSGLLTFLSYYGRAFLLHVVLQFIKSHSFSLKFDRVVELGAGYGWLGTGIAGAYTPIKPTLFIDKRQFPLIDILADIETGEGIKQVLDELKDGDLIVMSEVLHCLDNPRKVIAPFTKWPMLVIEYFPTNVYFRKSYAAQLEKYGAKAIQSIRDVLPGSAISTYLTDTHVMWLILPL